MFRRSLTVCVFLVLFSVSLAGTGFCREKLRVGIRALSPPFSFLAAKDGKRSVRGYSVDELSLIAKVLGVGIQFKPIIELGNRRKMFSRGGVDIMAHDSRSVANELGAEFIPIGVSLRHHLYVNKSCHSVTCLRDLHAKKVVAIVAALYSNEIKLGDDTIWVASPMDALNMVSKGVVDVFVAPSERVADDLIDRYQIPNIVKKGVVLGEIPLGILVSRRDPELAGRVRKAFVHLRETGVTAQLRDKWFGKPTISDDFQHYAKYIAIVAGLGGIIFVAIVLWNVSLKRRVAEVTNDLLRTEQRYRDLIESSPDMIFLVNEQGLIFHANERAHTFLVYPSSGEVFMQQMVTREYEEEVGAFLKKVFHDGCDKYELVMVGADKSLMEVEVAGRLIQGPARTELLACLFARNVTERNRMEEELIQSERLGIIGKMAASLAHEINNPLGIIQANAEDMLFDESLSRDTKEGLSAIQRNALRAGDITKGLLEAATPRPMTMETLEVGGLVYDALLLLGSKSKRERVSVEIDDGPLYIRGDERALQQVLVNLVFNSLAVIDETGTIRILAHGEWEGESGTVRIEVRDTGKGIPRKNLTQIFEPFFSSRKGGFGLGLFITRRMVQRLDGLIFAESEPGKGTSMFLEFPAVRPKE